MGALEGYSATQALPHSKALASQSFNKYLLVDIVLNAEDAKVNKISVQEMYSKTKSVRVICWMLSSILLEKGDGLFSKSDAPIH